MSLEKTLKEYGLKEKHAKVYLACLELGSGSVLKISQKATLPRSTTEVILNALQEKGFVSSFKKKKARYFSTEDPKKIIGTAKAKAELLEKALPEFRKLYARSNIVPTVRLYHDQQGMKLVLREILDEADALIGFGAVDDVYRVLGDYFPSFTNERIRRKIPLRVILRDTPLARQRQELGPKQLREVRLIQSDSPCSSITFIWTNKVAMFSLQEDMITLVIESTELSAIQRAMFELIWASLPIPQIKDVR